MKLRVKVILMFFTAAVLSIGSVASFSIINVSNETKQSINENISSAVDGYVKSFDGWIDQNAKIVESTDNVIGNTVGTNVGVSYLQAYKEKSNGGNINDLYVSLADGRFIDGSGWVPDSTYNAHTRVWYTGASNAGKEYITEPYVDAETGKYMITISYPLTGKNGAFEGVTAEDIFVSVITNEVNKIKYNNSGYAFLVDQNGTMIANPDSKLINKNIKNDKQLQGIYKKISASNSGQLEYHYNGQDLMMVYEKLPSTGWTLCLNVGKNLVYAPIYSLMLKYVGITALLLLIVLALGVLFSLSLTKPIAEMAALFEKAAQGDFTFGYNKKAKRRKDEIGILESSFESMASNIRAEAENARKIARGDLDFTIKEKSENDVLAISMRQVIETLNSLTENVNSISENAVDGNLEVRGDSKKFYGKYKQIIDGMNSTMEAIAQPILEVRSIAGNIAVNDYTANAQGNYRGIFKALVDDIDRVRVKLLTIQDNMTLISNGDTSSLEEIMKVGRLSLNDNMTPAMISMMQNIKNLIEEVNRISAESTNGNVIASRGDASLFKGGFREIIAGFNETLDSISTPLQDMTKVLNAMAVNDFTSEITDDYKGDYEKLGGALKSVTKSLLSAQDVAVKISNGDVSDLENFKRIGRRSENDKLLPAFVQMMETIDSLIKETTLIAHSASEGELGIRGDTSKFKGGYEQAVMAVNGLLDAVEAPVNEITDLMSKLNETGTLNLKVNGEYKGKFLILSDSINRTVFGLSAIISQISKTITEMAGYDLSMGHMRNYPGDYQALPVAINTILDSLNELLGSIYETAEQVASGSLQVSQGSQSLSQGTAEQASSVEELTASMAQIAAQTRQNASDSSEVENLVAVAKQSAFSGNVNMRELLSAMTAIGNASSEISKIIKVIDDITFQTNILSLNAAVEAARAGQYGKGFAVVAEEVRSLAARSAEAAKSTAALIENTVSEVQDGIKMANKTASALGDIVGDIDKVAAYVGQISASSNEQATGIAQIDMGLSQISKVIQTNSATSEESAAASEELAGQADLLKRQVSKFQLRKAVQ